MDWWGHVIPRRRYLRTLGGVGLASGLAGCNTSESTASKTETVVFTDTPANGSESDSPRPTNTSTSTATPSPETQIFHGGDIDSFAKAVRVAAELDATLEIDSGTYRFDPLEPPSSRNKHPHAEFQGFDDLTIEGNNSTIIFNNPEFGGFWFTTGKRITIRNLTFDYRPVPFTQGRIASFSQSDWTITLELDSDYPSLNHRMFERANTVYATTHDENGGFVSKVRTSASPDKHLAEIVALGDRKFRLHLQEDQSDFTGIERGHRLTVVARDNQSTLRFYKVDNPTFENVTIHTSNGSAFVMDVCNTPSFHGCTVAPPPDSNRQLASVADGIRITNCIDGSLVENCRHEQLGDDSVAVDNHMATLAGFESERTIAVDGVHPFVVQAGDVLEAISPSGVIRGQLPEIEAYRAQFSPVGERGKPETITFREPVEDILTVGDYLGNTATASEGYTIRNNEFRNHRANLIRANTGNGLIEDNVLDGVDGNAIELHTGTRGAWPPTCWVSDVTVRRNKIRRAGLKYIAGDEAAAIYLHHETPSGIPTEGQPNQNVEIVDNDIADCASVGIEAEATEGLRIEGNSMTALNQMDYSNKGFGVELSNVQDGTVAGNDVRGPAEELTGFGIRRECEKIASSDNTVRIAGEKRQGKLIQFVPVTFEFNRTVVPDGGNRKLAFCCFSLTLLSSEGTVIREISVGQDETGVAFGQGVDGREHHNGETWRWLGPDELSSVLYFHGNDMKEAEVLGLRGYAKESGIAATISVDGKDTDEITWTESEMGTYEIQLKQ